MPSLAEQASTIASLYQPPAVGRPSDIGSASTVQQFLEAVGDGNYIETAAKLAGLSKVSVYEWLKRAQSNEPGNDAFRVFANALEKAEARAEAKMLANVRKASELPQFWAAGMTVLERRHPDRWGKRQDDSSQPKVVVNIGVGSGDVKVGIQLSPPTFAPNSSLEDSANSLTDKACALSSSLITAVMLQPAVGVPSAESATDTIPIGNPLRSDRVGDPTPVGGGVGVPSRGTPKKGRSFLGRARRKKGVAGG